MDDCASMVTVAARAVAEWHVCRGAQGTTNPVAGSSSAARTRSKTDIEAGLLMPCEEILYRLCDAAILLYDYFSSLKQVSPLSSARDGCASPSMLESLGPLPP